jgi:hypothetical protein
MPFQHALANPLRRFWSGPLGRGTELPHRDPPRGMFPSAIFQRTGAGLSAIALAAAEALAAADLSRHPIRRRSREGGRAWHKPTLTHIDGNASVIIQQNF